MLLQNRLLVSPNLVFSSLKKLNPYILLISGQKGPEAAVSTTALCFYRPLNNLNFGLIYCILFSLKYFPQTSSVSTNVSKSLSSILLQLILFVLVGVDSPLAFVPKYCQAFGRFLHQNIQ
jgi:hypothetical protein